MKFEDYINEAVKRITLKVNIKKKINKDIINLTTPKNQTQYFDKIPLQPIFDILKKHGVIALQEDNTPWDGFLLGTNATVDFSIAPIDSKNGMFYTPYINAVLRLQYYKMASGRYEITSYIG